MEELIFFAVIIFFSIIDSIARSRKKKQAGAPAPEVPKSRERERSVPRYDTESSHEPKRTYESDRTFETQPTYDADASYDDDVREEAGSEGMIPADIWEEIAGLSRGRTPAPTKSVPAPPPVPVEVERIPARPVETHRVHRAHRGFGTDPSSRLRSEQDGLDPLAQRASADAQAVRSTLRHKGGHALRQALVLQEVLGPPHALREDRLAD